MYSIILAIAGLFILVSSPFGAMLLLAIGIVWFATSFPILFSISLVACIAGLVYYVMKGK